MFKLASLFVDIKADDGALRTQIGGVQKQLGAIGVAVGTAAGNLASTAVSAAASALFDFFKTGIVGATNMGESMSKVQAVFGSAAGTLTDTADQLAKGFGLSKQAILDAGAAIGLVGKAAGQSQQEAAMFGSNMAKLAADAASFYNVPLDEALNKIRSGLIGEAEPLRAFGVLLTEEAVAAEAVALGLAKDAKEVDNAAKVTARASLITKGLADATGDLERTQDSTANQFRKFTGSIENLAVAIGTSLAPATNEVLGLLNDLAQSIAGGPDSGEGAWKSFGEAAAKVFQEIRFHVRTFKDEIELARLQLGNLFGENDAKIQGKIWEIAARELMIKVEIGKKEREAAEAAAKRVEAQAKAAEIAKQQAANAKREKEEIEAAGRGLDELRRRQAEAMRAQARAAAEAARNKEKAFESQTFGVSQFAQHLQERIFSDNNDVPRQQLDVQKNIQNKVGVIAEELQKPRGAPAIMA